jgi:hypothetical protein
MLQEKKENIRFRVNENFTGTFPKWSNNRLLAVSPIYLDGTKIQPLFKYSCRKCIDKDNIEDIKTAKLHT